VTELGRAVKPIMHVRGHGHPGLAVTPEHPFYARQHQRHAPSWLPASALSRGWYWASPTTFAAQPIPLVSVARQLDITPDLMWLVGRYLGDGWTRLTATRAELVITCGPSEIDELRPLLNRWPRAGARGGPNELAWHERRTTTAYQFTTDHRGLVEWLRTHFGHRAEAKLLPTWAFGMAIELREALLAGYLSADGYDSGRFVECTTVSRALAFSIKTLAQTLGKTVAVYRGANSTEIQGRTVNARPVYRLRWRHQVDKAHEQTWRTESLEWSPVRESVSTGETAEVYNIGVEDDESYVVESIVVHNCKHFSKAKGGKPVSKKIRGLAWTAVRWATAVRPRVIVLENVEEFQTWGPVDRTTANRPCPERKGHTFKRFVARLRRLGYQVEWKRAPRLRLRRADDSEAPVPDRALRRSADRLADADARQRPRAAVAHRGGVHRLVDRVPVDLRAEEGARGQHAPADRARDQAVRHRLAEAVHRASMQHVERLADDRRSTRPLADDHDPRGTSSTSSRRTSQSSTAVRPARCSTEPRRRRRFEQFRETITGGAVPLGIVAPHARQPHARRRRSRRGSRSRSRTITGAHRGEQALIAPFLKPRFGEDPDPSRRGGLGQAPRVRCARHASADDRADRQRW
jgi:hypothetical protein